MVIRFKIVSISVQFQDFDIGQVDGYHLCGKLYNPFPAGQNSHYESAKAHCRTWILSHELFEESDRGFKKFIAGDFAKLASYCYRHESESDLQLVTDFISWLFKHDDFRDSKDIEIGKDPNKIFQMNVLLERVLESGELPSAEESIIHEYPIITKLANALLDIRTRLIERAQGNDISYFVKSMHKYFQGNVWEATNREISEVPSTLNYQQWRKHTSAVMPTYEFGYILRAIKIPDEIREDIAFESMSNNSSNVVCFTNDLFSLKKEKMDGVVENLVIVKMNEDGLTTDKAFVKSIQITNEEVRQYTRLSKNSFQHFTMRELVLELQESWMDGNFRWSQETKRYK